MNYAGNVRLSRHIAEVLDHWVRVFTNPKVWVSEQGSNFKNIVVEHFSASNHIKNNSYDAY